MTDEVANESEKNLGGERPAGEEDVADAKKESPTNEAEEKDPEDKVNSQFYMKYSISFTLYLQNI